MSKLRAADIATRSLANAGVKHVFALSGNHIMPMFDATIEAGIEIVHVHQEAAATHMADAHGRLTGEPGVCLFTGGPGHANAVGPLFTALGGESPVVMISGHAPLNQLGLDAFQELRQAEMAAPVCKASWTAHSAEGLGEDIARALTLARSGRPGPVHLSVPTDVMEAMVDNGEARIATAPSFSPTPAMLQAPIADAMLTELTNAKRPLIITGPMLGNGRGRRLREALRAATGIPVLYMESPRGVADPVLGAAADVLATADVVLMLGKKLDFTVRFGNAPVFDARCRFLQIDPDAEALRRAALAIDNRARIVQAIVADTLPACEAMIAAAHRHTLQPTAWTREVDAALSYQPLSWAGIQSREGAIHALDIGRALRTVVECTPNAIYISDGGEASQWSQACIAERALMRMTNGPGGAIGGGVPFAIAAKFAHPKSPVLLTTGDGSFGYHLMEYETAVRHRVPFVAIVANDGAWNAEYQIQLRTYGEARAVGCEMSRVRYDLLVSSLGGHGELVTRATDLASAIERALASAKPACINAMVDRVCAPSFTHRVGAPRTSEAS